MTPRPYRGDQLAAGVVGLAVLVAVCELRFDGDAATGWKLLWAAAALAFVGTLAWRAPMEGPAPRAYQSVLYGATFALAAITVVRGVQLLGGTDASAGAVAGGGAVLCALAWVLAQRRGSALMTLLASVAGTAALVGLADLVLGLGARGSRRVLLVAVAVLVLLAVARRDRAPAHAAQHANAAGLALGAIALSLLAQEGVLPAGAEGSGIGFGWELVILAVALGQLAYGAVDHERGSAYLGFFNLVAWVALVSLDGSLVGWPLALGALTAAMLAIALRPTTPAPPEPPARPRSTDARPGPAP